MFEICALNFVDQGAFVVAPAENHLDFMAFGIVFQRFYQLFVRGFAVYVRFAYSQQIQIRSVEHQKFFHSVRLVGCYNKFKMFSAAVSASPSFAMRSSAAER